MAQPLQGMTRERAASGAVVALLHALIAWGLIAGLGIDPVEQVREQLKLFDVTVEPPPPPIAEPPPPSGEMTQRRQTPEPEGAAAPPSLRNTPTPVVAPKPIIRLPVPPPIPAAVLPGQGSAPRVGAAEIPGPGTGRGGEGEGTGSGRFGSGTGGGGGGGDLGPRVRPQLIEGAFYSGDYPREADEAQASGTTYIRFVIAPNGRVTECAVTRSSGRADLDEATCRILRRRFRYRPARDEHGRPVPYVMSGPHVWQLDIPPAENEQDD